MSSKQLKTVKTAIWLLAFTAGSAWAGAQQYEPMSASVKSQLLESPNNEDTSD